MTVGILIPDFSKEASSYNQLSPHKVMSRSNLHFLFNYNLIISNDCGDVNVYATSKSSLSVNKRIFPFNKYVLNFPGV
jgi:hypothetical protein